MNGAGNALVSTALVDQLMKGQHEALLGRNEAQHRASRSQEGNRGFSVVPVCALRPGCGDTLQLSRSRVWRSLVLFAASIVFLGLLAHDPIVFLPLIGFLLLGYAGLLSSSALVQIRGVEHPGRHPCLRVAEEYTFLRKAPSCATPISRWGSPTSSFACASVD